MATITPESASIMRLLGMGAHELDIPLRYSMFEEVSAYFADPSTAARKILAVIAKTPSRDALETVWHYVRLQNERREAIRSIDPAEFESPISDELKEGVLTVARMKELEAEMSRREASHRDRIARKEVGDEKEGSEILQKAVTSHAAIRRKFDLVREINGALEYYDG